jgi:4-oxalocrotonate tautomerase
LVAVEESGNAIDSSSSDRERIQSRTKVQKSTDATVSIEGANMRGVTWVKISEDTSGEWAFGGRPLTTKAVKDLAAGRKAA